MADLDGRDFFKERRGSGWVLVPSNEWADDWLATIKEKQHVLIHGHVPRNIKHHGKYWVIVHKVYENLPDDLRAYIWPRPEDFADDIKDATGLHQTRMRGAVVNAPPNPLTGLPRRPVGSIAFESMDQAKFNAWYDKAINLLSREVIGCMPDELRQEIEDIIDGKSPPPSMRMVA